MHNIILLPWGSLAAMEFSDPETNPSPNQLAVIHMHILELLITQSNSTSTQGGVSSLKMKQTKGSENVMQTLCVFQLGTMTLLSRSALVQDEPSYLFIYLK